MDQAGLILISGKPKDEPDYDLMDDTAVVRVRGSMMAESSWWGGESYARVVKAARAAAVDPAAARIVLDIKSPGGTVDGVFEAAAALSKLEKPLYAYANGQMTSGALILGSAAKMIAAPKTAQIGSIGVLTVHVDESRLDERIGIKVTYLTAGKYKAYGNTSEPLSEDARNYIQDRLDQLYSMFIDSVAKSRGMSVEKVLAAADGKIFLAGPAKDAGLVDVIVEDINDFISIIKNKEDQSMDLQELKTKHPALVTQIEEGARVEAKKTADQDADVRISAAKKAETDKLMAIVKAVAGDEAAAKIEKIVSAGLSADQLAAVMGIMTPAAAPAPAPAAVEGDGKAKILAAIAGATPAPLNAAAPAPEGGPGFEALLVEAMKANPKLKKSEAIFELRKIHIAAYDEWIKKQQAK